FLAVDYRGYGNSGGTPSASSMMLDARAIFQYVQQWLTSENRSGALFVMGRSLGSASALEIAYSFEKEISGLILESAFAQTLPLLLALDVDIQKLGISEMDGFKNVQKIELITKPVFILHAQRDTLLPLVNAEILHSKCAARSKELSIVPGADHNTIINVAGDLYFAVLKQFTNKILKVRTHKPRSKTK
nr:alpha/beta hydrolase [Desulfobulbaceae bacterium]